MSGPGEDILAWLNAAINLREQVADLARKGGSGRWRSGPDTADRYAYAEDFESAVVEDDQGRTVVCNDVWPSKPVSVHIALNDPESVLRRSAADRKLLELHQPVADHGRYSEPECPDDCDGQHDGPPVCMACRGYTGDPLRAPCTTVSMIAEGYGWTGGVR